MRLLKPLNERKAKQTLINKLDRLFSKFIREKYCEDRAGQCYTCGGWFLFKDLDAGHYIGRAYYSHRWDIRNVRPQCYDCNCLQEGKKGKFRLRLVEEYGEDVVSIMEGTKHKRKPDIFTLKYLINQYSIKK